MKIKPMEMDISMLLNDEQKTTQISSSHRLINLTRKLRHNLDVDGGYGENHEIIDPYFFIHDILAGLENKLNISISKRQSALLKRIKTKKDQYSSNPLTPIEYATEAIFDNYFFKNNDDYVNRLETSTLIKESINRYGKIILVMPVLSRKPFSPIKNKGIFPDLGEINTLLRCAKLAKLISNISGFPCEFLILADGHKYNRACKTPHEVVSLYQQSLRYWVNYLHIDEYVKITDYEEWIVNADEVNWQLNRECLYNTIYQDISKKYDKAFCFNDLDTTFNTMELDELGKQLKYTYWSIMTSVNYTSLYPKWSRGMQIYTKENQNFYLSFISASHYSLERIKKSHLFVPDLVGDMSHCAVDIIMNMRNENWEAAKRYVSISLADRQLNTIFRKIPTALKLTIHAKKGEFNFIATNQKSYSMTAQHTVAGIKRQNDSITVDYQYRLTREAEKQTGVYIHTPNHRHGEFDPLYEMSLIKQPIYYITK
ncbi:L-tyrosine/L-tryptophan isonitrile synthase family protein [Pectobacterium aroidearum]|uniref:L-tyrosine/L-tryptophan isonitrile synthase family protein n=1 Tax=Pectobacterium aroidearum TaxID=1201031 RepID=UPI0032ECBE44